jgi:putative phosphoesterase
MLPSRSIFHFHDKGGADMKFLVISDSHGRTSALEEIVQLCKRDPSYDAVIHLGDYERDARYIRERIRQPVYGVPGNRDFVFGDDSELVLPIGGVRMLLTHGHRYHVKMNLFSLGYRAAEAEVQAVLFGHTHAQYNGYEQGVLFLNPGALQDEKCAVLTVEKGEISAKLTRLEKIC